MAGQKEQGRRAFAAERASRATRSRVLREILELCKTGNLTLVQGYIEAQLGMTKPFSEIRKTLDTSATGDNNRSPDSTASASPEICSPKGLRSAVNR